MNLKDLVQFGKAIIKYEQNLISNHLDFESGGILSKPVSLEYRVQGHQPWAIFECLENEAYNFAVHELQFGVMEGNSAAVYWILASKEKKVEFQGFANRLYPHIGLLRGYLSVPKDNYKMGIQVRKGGILKLKTQKELIEDSLEAFNIIEPMILSFKKKELSTGQDSNLGKVGLQPTGVTTVPPVR
jgi:hypothetical protein